MAEHALLSPSSAVRWLTCAGSVTMESRYAPKSSAAAEYGTACHELAEKALRAGEWVARAYIGGRAKNGMTFTEDMADLVAIYLNNLMQYQQGHSLLVEHRIDFSRMIGVPNSFGTADAIIITTDGKELQIHDLKTGYHLVHAKDNPQLMLYALGALDEFGVLGDYERVRLVIHQPTQNHLDEWDCSIAEIIEFGKYAKEQAQTAMAAFYTGKPQDHLRPSEKGCQYCRAAADCPALANFVASTIGASFEDLTHTDTNTLIPKDPLLLSAKMTATDTIENWIKSVRAQVERELLAGENVPGYKIVQGKQGNRKWLDEGEVVKIFKSMRMAKDQMYHSTLISPTDAEKILRIAPEKWALVQPFVIRTEGALSVAPEKDKRPAIIITPPDQMFNDLTERALT